VNVRAGQMTHSVGFVRASASDVIGLGFELLRFLRETAVSL
jgi:hypothetical protein